MSGAGGRKCNGCGYPVESGALVVATSPERKVRFGIRVLQHELSLNVVQRRTCGELACLPKLFLQLKYHGATYMEEHICKIWRAF